MRAKIGRYWFELTAAGVIACLILAGWLWYSRTFPYGRSHSCIKWIAMTLEEYAREHDGRYPSGEESPEASLGLLYSDPWGLDAEALRGKTVPAEVVQNVFDSGGKLSAETTGWHYVEGLTKKDNPDLALLWDKVGLGHNGEWTGGTREVVFVGGEIRAITAEEWPQFLKEQERLLAERDAARAAAGPAPKAGNR